MGRFYKAWQSRFVARAVSDDLVSGNKSTGSFQRLAAKVLDITTVLTVR